MIHRKKSVLITICLALWLLTAAFGCGATGITSADLDELLDANDEAYCEYARTVMHPDKLPRSCK